MADYLNDFKQDLKARLNPDKTAPKYIRAANIEAARGDLRLFANLINPEFYRPNRAYQDIICSALQGIYEKKLINPNTGNPYDILVINMPPGFGKSYTTMMFSAWAFGQDNRNKIISVSYNQTLSFEFARGVRDMIQDEEIAGDVSYYCARSVFPKLKIKQGNASLEKWSLEGRRLHQSYLATSFDGSITGMRGNIIILDDPIKNHKEAANDAVKEGHWRFFTDTLQSRLLPGGIQIIVQTRWATDDLAGRVIAHGEFGKRCYVLKMEALTETGSAGPRSLCEGVYPIADLLKKQKTISEEIWAANFQQIPIDIIGALYGGFKTYDALDTDKFERVIAYIDTADTGADYLCAVMGGVIGRYGYITDVYYTDAPMEVTEPETARKLADNKVREAIIESNNGGRGFARNVERLLKEFKSRRCNITWFHQNKNKRTRIIVNAANIIEQVIMPEGWQEKWPAFAKAINRYQRKGKNDHDDAPDALTGFVEVINGDVKGKGRLRIGDISKLGM